MSELIGMGYTKDIAEKFIEDQASWLTRDEIASPNNIDDTSKVDGLKNKIYFGGFFCLRS